MNSQCGGIFCFCFDRKRSRLKLEWTSRFGNREGTMVDDSSNKKDDNDIYDDDDWILLPNQIVEEVGSAEDTNKILQFRSLDDSLECSVSSHGYFSNWMGTHAQFIHQ